MSSQLTSPILSYSRRGDGEAWENVAKAEICAIAMTSGNSKQAFFKPKREIMCFLGTPFTRMTVVIHPLAQTRTIPAWQFKIKLFVINKLDLIAGLAYGGMVANECTDW